MSRNHLESVTAFILVSGLLLTAFFYLLAPVGDPDFFWHLKTGEWIWQNKRLPSEDPFAYTTGLYNFRTHHILTAYWLSQLMNYLLYMIAGMGGIVFLRFLILGMLMYLLFRRKEGDKIIVLALLWLSLTALLLSYSFERPHVFSFLFFAALLYVISSIRNCADLKTGYRPMIFLAGIMILWSNSHRGVILGQAVLTAYMAIEGLKFIHPALRPMPVHRYKYLLRAGILGLASSLLNPNSYRAVLMLSSADMATNKEYLSALQYFSAFENYGVAIYWGLLVLAIVGLLLDRKRSDAVESALLAVTGIASFLHVRYTAFFLIAAVPAIGRSFSGGLSLRALRAFRILIVSVALYAGIFFAWDARNNVRNLMSGRWISSDCPVQAAEFIIENDLRGAMYNYYDFGGYLIWRLGPERKVFIDGRVLFDDIYHASQLIDAAYSGQYAGLPYWKSVLKAYNVGYIVAPVFISSGQLYELLPALMQDREWVPVFVDRVSIIFVSSSSDNGAVIKKHAISKEYLAEELLQLCDSIISAEPRNFMAYTGKGDLLVIRGRYEDARLAYEKALEISPSYPEAARKLGLLRDL